MEKLTVTIERRIATVRIRNPPLNILDDDLRRALFAAFGELEARDDIHVVVVEAGPGQAFSAGSNIREFPSDEIGGVAKIRFEQHLHNRLADLPAVTIAKLGAATLGGGGELMLACDFRIAAAGITIGFPEIRLGALPAAGGIKRLVQEIGPARARSLVMFGKPMAAEEALAIGVIHDVVPEPELDRRVEALASELASLPLDALLLAKRCIAAAVPQTAVDTAEAEAFGQLFRGRNLREGLSAFLEKRRPDFDRER